MATVKLHRLRCPDTRKSHAFNDNFLSVCLFVCLFILICNGLRSIVVLLHYPLVCLVCCCHFSFSGVRHQLVAAGVEDVFQQVQRAPGQAPPPARQPLLLSPGRQHRARPPTQPKHNRPSHPTKQPSRSAINLCHMMNASR